MNAIVLHDDEPKRVLQSMPPANPMQILQIAVQQGADVDRLQKLMELQERWEANLARKAFDAAMSDAKSKIKPIVKKREVDFTSSKGRTNYKYEDLALIAEEVDPILSEYGLSYRYRSRQEGNKLFVTCVICHRDGHSEETELFAANDETGNKNSIQAIGSTATFLQRYTLKLALGLSATKDDDGRGAGVQDETITESQAADLNTMGQDVGADREKFLKFMGVEKLRDIKAKDFQKALAALKAKGASK